MEYTFTCDRGEVYSHQQSEVGGDVIHVVGATDVCGRLLDWYRKLAFLLDERASWTIVTPQVV